MLRLKKVLLPLLVPCFVMAPLVFFMAAPADLLAQNAVNSSAPPEISPELPSDLEIQLEALKQQAKDTFQAAKEKLSESAKDGLKKLDPNSPEATMAKEEIAKLFQIEYRVVELDGDLSTPALEKTLVELGKDRWDCFQAGSERSKLRLICKRHPPTYLRYLPQLLRSFGN